MQTTILNADVIEALEFLSENSFDGCLTDPPYGLSFMGKQWDYDVPGPDIWAEVLRVLKPGAMMLAFGGTRTHHRLWCAIEDAGFEVRDCLMWVYGSGFPKSLDVSKAIDKAAGAERKVIGTAVYGDGHVQNSGESIGFGGCDPEVDRRTVTAPATDAARQWNGYGTALKPAYEPILLAMKPLDGTFANNALKHGVAGLNVDGCRVNPGEQVPGGGQSKRGRNGGGIYGDGQSETGAEPHSLGRWPANLIHDGSEEVVSKFPGTGTSSGGGMKRDGKNNNVYGEHTGHEKVRNVGFKDSGSAARFFYAAKSSKSERNTGNINNTHPTVKPLKLCAYLSKLILPPPRDTARKLLVPFSGSGSEVIGGLQAGWDTVVGVELSPEYCELSEARIQAVKSTL